MKAPEGSDAGPKLHKFLADLGLGSRREMERWISAGRVQVNGRVATLGDRLAETDHVSVDGKRVDKMPTAPTRVLVLNKPTGLVCSRRDEAGRASVFDDLPRLKQGRWISIGRLDIQTSGLLLFTTDGNLANRMMRPSTGLDREYAVRVGSEISQAAIDALTAGVVVDGETLAFSDIRYYNGSENNHWYHVVLMEGKNREVRRLFDAVDVEVSRLKRVRYGPVVMPSWVRRGQSAEMGAKDIHALYKLLKLRYRLPPKKQARERDAKANKSMLIPYPALESLST